MIRRSNVPSFILASHHFDEDPLPVELQGVLHENAPLFRLLDRLEDPEARGHVFDDFITVRFELHRWQEQATLPARRSLKNSYLRFLKGWGMDSNSVEGAVLKGWVESRFGIPPRFHHAPLDAPDSEAYLRYSVERAKGRAFTSAIDAQLDLVYAYTQYELRRREPEAKSVVLWRGQNCLTPEQRILDLGPREWVIRLNNVASFTDDKERAWEFGSFVIEAQIALPRIFFAGHLLPRSVLRGEREYLVIGSDVKARRILF